MLAKFIFLSLCSFSVDSLQLLKNPKREEGNGSELQGATWGHEQPLRALALSDQEPRPSINRSRSRLVSPVERKLLNPFSQSPRENYFTAEKRLETKESWIRNQDLLKSIYQHSQKLSDLGSQLKYKYLMSLTNTWHKPGLNQWEKYAVEGLTQFNERLALLKQVRLLELGGINLPTSNSNLMALPFSEPMKKLQSLELTKDVIEQISDLVWQGLGQSIVDELKQVIIKNQLFLLSSTDRDSQEIGFICWKYALTMIDFLYKSQFVGEKVVQGFFQDSNIITKFINYTGWRLEEEVGQIFDYGSPRFHKKWYWDIWHPCFQALSKNEENLLHGKLLLQCRYRRILEVIKKSRLHVPIWSDFFISAGAFDPSKYLKQLESGSKSLTSTSKNTLYRDIKRIVEIINAPGRQFHRANMYEKSVILRYLSDILDFFEECIYPGAIKESLAGYPEDQQYEDHYKVYKIIYQMHDLSWNAVEYMKYVRSESPKDWSTSSIYKEKFDDYLNPMIQKLSEFKEGSSQIRQKWLNQENQSVNVRKLLAHEAHLQEAVERMLKDSAEFKITTIHG